MSATHYPSGAKRYPINRLRQCWNDMRKRCLNPANKSYPDYGGRGITICARWSDYESFAADVGPHPGPGMQLDRKDNAKGYEPGNVHWVNRATQCRNRRSNVFVEWLGVRKCFKDWCAALGISYKAAHQRTRRGMSPEEALGLDKV